jgi:general stress protein 26
MPTPLELEVKFWKALRADLTVMIGTGGNHGAHPKPMTAQFEDDHGPLWFFTTKDSALVEAMGADTSGVATFASKGHELFATIEGTLSVENDASVIDKFWNRYVAAWYEGGKDDPNLALLKFEPISAEIWQDASSFLAGVKLLLGMDPKAQYKDSVAQINMRH